MNYAQSFEEFSSKLSPTDLMVYAGAALIIFVLFKDQLSPVKEWLLTLYSKLINRTSTPNTIDSSIVVSPVLKHTKPANNDNNFLQLISSWKSTRDLASKMSCKEAVKILDSAFSHLGPNNCSDNNGDSNQ